MIRLILRAKKTVKGNPLVFTNHHTFDCNCPEVEEFILSHPESPADLVGYEIIDQDVNLADPEDLDTGQGIGEVG